MNSFESLCRLASNERWCWKLYCTTCGTMHFRYSLVELAKGKSPEDIDWPIHKETTSYSNKLGRYPRVFSDDIKDKVLKICLNADIRSISKNCNFPDWLGYLGFVLEHMYTNNDAYKLVSINWTSQLRDIVPPGTRSHERLVDIAKSGSALLVKDLEVIEKDMLSHPKN